MWKNESKPITNVSIHEIYTKKIQVITNHIATFNIIPTLFITKTLFFRLIRYEDILLSRIEIIEDLMSYVGLNLTPYMNQYLTSHKPVRTGKYENLLFNSNF